jgi:hypothetical protein
MNTLFQSCPSGQAPACSGALILLPSQGQEAYLFRGSDLASLSFGGAAGLLYFEGVERDGIGEFVAGPQELSLSFILAYRLSIPFPAVLVNALLNSGKNADQIASLTLESLFREVVAPCCSSAMLTCLSKAGPVNLPIVKKLLGGHGFSRQFEAEVNRLVLPYAGLGIHQVRFGVADRSSLLGKTLSVSKKVAAKVGR